MRRPVIILVLWALSISSKSIANDKVTSPEIVFKENKGQVVNQYRQPRNDIMFYGSGNGLNYFLKNNGISYQLYKGLGKTFEPSSTMANVSLLHTPDSISVYRVDISWPGANTKATIIKDASAMGVENFYNLASPITNVKAYTSVTYQHIYPLINLKYYSQDGSLKYDYVVEPGGNYRDIQLKIQGIDTIIQNGDGSVTLRTPFGEIHEGRPIVYQEQKRIGAYWVIENNCLGFKIDSFDTTKELVIDPIVFRWNEVNGNPSSFWTYTYMNASSATDKKGNFYFCGYWYTNYNLQISTGTFIQKRDSAGVGKGGGQMSGINDFTSIGNIYTDLLGNAYVSGTTSTPNVATSGAHQVILGGNTDAFLRKYDSSMTLVWASYYGGPNHDYGKACAADSVGNVFLVGITSSIADISTPNAHQAFLSGKTDGFIAKFDTNGSRLWGTYYGGSEDDHIQTCAYANGNFYFGGHSNSSSNIATAGAHQSTYAGTGLSGFLANFNLAGQIQWGTYYGNDTTQVTKCVVDAFGDIYIIGNTTDVSSIATSGVHQSTFGGAKDGFLVKFGSGGSRIWGTYYGGMGTEILNGLCISDSTAYICGTTTSGSNIATSGSYQGYKSGGDNNAFIAELNLKGQRLSGSYYSHTTPFAGAMYDTWGQDCSAFYNDVYLVGYAKIHLSEIASIIVRFQRCALVPPVITPSSSIHFCYGDSMYLSVPASSGSLYTWYRDGISLGLPNQTTKVYPTTTGSYYVLLKKDGCSTYSQPVTVVVNPRPTFNFYTVDVPCYGGQTGQIYLNTSDGTPPYSFTWSGIVSTDSILTNLAPGTYTATVVDSNGCSTTMSMQILKDTSAMPSHPLASVCAVTVDSASGKNLVIWEKTGVRHASKYNIYRESSLAGQYNLVGTKTAGQFSTFLDTSSNPLQQSYRYKISEMDSCNNEFALSDHHKTIHLTSNVGVNGEVNLIWNNYDGKDYGTHYIMRSNGNSPFTKLDEVSSTVTSYSDLNPPAGNKIYRIDIDLPAQCVPTAKTTAYNRVSSNLVALIVKDSTVAIRLSPNPTSGLLAILGTKPSIIVVSNLLGQKLMEVRRANELSMSGLSRGIYIVSLYDDSGKRYYMDRVLKQ